MKPFKFGFFRYVPLNLSYLKFYLPKHWYCPTYPTKFWDIKNLPSLLVYGWTMNDITVKPLFLIFYFLKKKIIKEIWERLSPSSSLSLFPQISHSLLSLLSPPTIPPLFLSPLSPAKHTIYVSLSLTLVLSLNLYVSLYSPNPAPFIFSLFSKIFICWWLNFSFEISFEKRSRESKKKN